MTRKKVPARAMFRPSLTLCERLRPGIGLNLGMEPHTSGSPVPPTPPVPPAGDNLYLQPDGIFEYLQPDGAQYLQPP